MMRLPLPWRRGADAAAAESAIDAPAGPRPVRRPSGGNRRSTAAGRNAAAAGRERRGRGRERRRQYIAYGIGAALLLVIAGIVAWGIYREFVLPPRIMAGEVRQVRFTMGDLVERIRVLQGINRYEGGQVDFSRVPFEMLMNLVRAEILRQAAPGLQIEVAEADIDEELRERFRPEANPGEEPDESQLDAEYDNAYANFLEQVNLTDGAYRRIVEEELQRRELFAYMLATVPDESPQVEVQAITMGVNSDADPTAVKERLNLGEDFSSVALEISGSDGYIGWMPEGVVPEFDPYLYGDTECLAQQESAADAAPADDAPADDAPADDAPANDAGGVDDAPAADAPADAVLAECDGPILEPGETSDPIYVNETIVLLNAIGPPETREVAAQMQFQLAGALVEQWQEDQVAKGSDEGWVKINFNSDRYAWVTDQVRQTRPRVTLTPQP